MEKQEQKKSIVFGIIGAIIGAMIATIPWVLMYVYGEMILSLLAILIAMGALMGYQLFKGKITKQLPIIISIISLIMVVVATLVVIPLLLLGKENLPMTWNNVEILYQSTEFKNALFKDHTDMRALDLPSQAQSADDHCNQLPGTPPWQGRHTENMS